MPLLVGVQGFAVLPDDVIVSGQEEASGAAGGVADRLVRRGLHHVHDGPDEFPRREILARSLGRLLGALGQQALVNVALHVGLHRQPLLLVDQVHDQAAQQGGVLDLRLGLLEDRPQHPRLAAQVFEDVAVVGLQAVALLRQQARPVVALGHDGLAAVGRLGLLVGHLQEQQEGDLLRVGHVGQAVVPQDVCEVSRLGDHLLGDVAHAAPPSSCGSTAPAKRRHSFKTHSSHSGSATVSSVSMPLGC